MILHIPHSSTRLATETGDFITLARPLENLFYLTDYLTDEIFCSGKGEAIIFPFSRFVCDVERLENDYLDAYGKGIIYKTDIFGNEIERHVSDDVVMMAYRAHHKRLNKAVAQGLTLLPKVVVVDCHSFPSDIDHTQVCIGTDKDHTPNDLVQRLREYFEVKHKLMLSLNYPYQGTIIPSDHVDNPNVLSVMIEINKGMYSLSKSNLEETKSLIAGALDIIYDYEFNS